MATNRTDRPNPLIHHTNADNGVGQNVAVIGLDCKAVVAVQTVIGGKPMQHAVFPYPSRTTANRNSTSTAGTKPSGAGCSITAEFAMTNSFPERGFGLKPGYLLQMAT